jgi:hypothetical protein
MAPSLAVVAALASLSAGCVTINIYFPAAAAEAAADRIIDEVWQLRDPAATVPAETRGEAQ